MLTKQLEIINPLGLHARAAAKLVQVSSRFASQITIRLGEKNANAKSIMNVMMLAASRGTFINVSVEGEDQDEAFDEVIALIEDGFGEME